MLLNVGEDLPAGLFFLGSLNRPASLVGSRTRAAQENGREGEEGEKKSVQFCDGDEEVVVDVSSFVVLILSCILFPFADSKCSVLFVLNTKCKRQV